MAHQDSGTVVAETLAHIVTEAIEEVCTPQQMLRIADMLKNVNVEHVVKTTHNDSDEDDVNAIDEALAEMTFDLVDCTC